MVIIRDASALNVGDLNARAKDATARPGLTNLLMRPMVVVFPKAIVWVAVAEFQVAKGSAISLLSGGPIRLMYVIILTFRSILLGCSRHCILIKMS